MARGHAAAQRCAQDLTGRLDEAASACAELCELASLKRRALVGGDLPSLESVVAREEAAAERLLQAERLGREALASLGRCCGVAEVRTISDLDGLIPAAVAPRLAEARMRLLGLMTELRAQNRHNAELLSQALAYVDHCLGVLLPGSRAATYGSSGDRPRAGGRAAGLLNRAV